MDADERRFWKWASRNPSGPLVEGVEGHCWIWLGSRTRRKQPLFFVDGRTRTAIPWLWERENGPRPSGMQLSALCRNPICVRPSHHVLRPRGSHLRAAARQQ